MAMAPEIRCVTASLNVHLPAGSWHLEKIVLRPVASSCPDLKLLQIKPTEELSGLALNAGSDIDAAYVDLFRMCPRLKTVSPIIVTGQSTLPSSLGTVVQEGTNLSKLTLCCSSGLDNSAAAFAEVLYTLSSLPSLRDLTLRWVSIFDYGLDLDFQTALQKFAENASCARADGSSLRDTSMEADRRNCHGLLLTASRSGPYFSNSQSELERTFVRSNQSGESECDESRVDADRIFVYHDRRRVQGDQNRTLDRVLPFIERASSCGRKSAPLRPFYSES
jgi:hypothetical protein